MRNPGRIPIIMEFFKENPQALHDYTESDRCEIIRSGLHSIVRWGDIYKKWEENPDLRFGQLLIIIHIEPDSQSLFYREEVDWLTDRGYFKKEDLCKE